MDQAAPSQSRDAPRRKDELSAAIAHDIRSPLAAVKGAIDILIAGAAGALTEDQRHYLEIAERATRHVLDLVNDLLDASMLDAGLVRLECASVDVRVVCLEEGAEKGIAAQEKGITLATDLPDELPRALADRSRLAQVVANLLGNSVKFTNPGGRIVLRARDTGRGVSIEIVDTGVGMSPAMLEQLFDRAHRSHTRGTRGERGTGLGLYICRQLVELHGGVLEVTSRLGEGTTFRFTLPPASEGA